MLDLVGTQIVGFLLHRLLLYFQVTLGDSLDVDLENVTKIVITLDSPDTGEEVEVKLSVVGCTEDVPGMTYQGLFRGQIVRDLLIFLPKISLKLAK